MKVSLFVEISWITFMFLLTTSFGISQLITDRSENLDKKLKLSKCRAYVCYALIVFIIQFILLHIIVICQTGFVDYFKLIHEIIF